MNASRYRFVATLLALALFAPCAGIWAQGDEGLALRRYGLFVGANEGGAGRARLQYAETDSRAMAEVLQEIGGMSPKDAVVLVNPDAGRLRSEIQSMGQRIQRERTQARRVEFVFYYSGHSDEQSLLLGSTQMGYGELRDAVRALDTDLSIAILDSCASGAFTRLKGGQRAAPFLVDESSEVQGQVYLTSSSENEASQESDAIGGSFFTHSLVSALRGAADMSQDGKVTLHEAYQYATADTLARTENTQAGPQHPSWYINLTGTGDLVLTDLRTTTAALAMSEDLSGTVFIRDQRGNLVAEVRKLVGLPLTLALPPGNYSVAMYTDQKTSEARVVLRDGSRTSLAPSDFRESARLATRSRGDEDAEDGGLDAAADEETEWVRTGEERALEAVRVLDPIGISGFISKLTTEIQRKIWGGLEPGTVEDEGWTRADKPEQPVERERPERATVAVEPKVVPISLGFVPGIAYPGGEARKIVSINALIGSSYSILGFEASGVLNITSHDVLGAQVAGVGNIVSGRLAGYQGAGVFNITRGTAAGVQTAGVFSMADSAGVLVQVSGVFSMAQSPLAGAQVSGVFNLAERLAGVQVGGVLNVAREDANGAQIAGVLNLADAMRGIQIAGVLNVASEARGLQIGVINYGGDAAGVQVGVLNIARSLRGLPIGLVNIISDGLILGSLSWDDRGFNTLELASGTRLYTLLSFGARFGEDAVVNALSTQAGLGLHLPLGPFFVAGDISARSVYPMGAAGEWPVASEAIPFPSIRGRLGILLFDRIGGFLGYTADVQLGAGFPVSSVAHTGKSFPVTLGSWTFAMYPRFVAGISVGRQP